MQQYRITVQCAQWQWVWYLFPWVHKQILEVWKYLISSLSSYSPNYNRNKLMCKQAHENVAFPCFLKIFLKYMYIHAHEHMYSHMNTRTYTCTLIHSILLTAHYSQRCVNRSPMLCVLQNNDLQKQLQGTHTHSPYYVYFFLLRHTNNS